MATPTAEVIIMDNYRVGSPFLANLPSLNTSLPGDSPFYKVSVEIADKGGLKPKRSSMVLDKEPVLAAWPNLQSQILEILEDTLWLAIELLRRGTDDEDGNNNPITILITISEI